MKNLLLFILPLLALNGCNRQQALDEAWLVQIGGGGPELVYDLTETADGRVCSTGSFWASVTFGADELRQTLATDGTQDIFVACYDAAGGQLNSVTQFGTHRGDDVRAIAAMPNGDVVITGVFSGQFGAGGRPELTTENSADIFLSRLDRQGNSIWAKRFSSAQGDSGTALAITPDGDIVLGGHFSETMYYPAGNRTGKLNSAGQTDGVIIKLTGDGDVIWARSIGGSGYDTVSAIAIAGDGTIVSGGAFQAEAWLSPDRDPIRSTGYNDVFIARLTSDGEPVWLQRLGGAQQDTIDGLALDSRGRIHLAGSFQGAASFGDEVLQSNGSTDIYFVRMDQSGEIEHAYSIGSQHTDQLYDLSINKDDTLLYTGHFQGHMDFAPGRGKTLRSTARPGDANAFLLALDDEAKLRQIRTVGGVGVEMGLAVVSLRRGGFVVAGVFNEQLDARIESLGALSNRGKSDVFLLRAGARNGG